jgi:MerR family transcriptional regulator, Zn(II)-responsive regulator of zntA
MKVNELARSAQVSPHAVRYYSRAGLLKPIHDPANGYRRFAASDVHRVRFIRLGQSLGFTLSDIGKILQTSARRESPCPLARDIITRRIDAKEHEIQAVVALWERMRRARDRWRKMPDRVPVGEEICRLIESGDDAKPALMRAKMTHHVGQGAHSRPVNALGRGHKR